MIIVLLGILCQVRVWQCQTLTHFCDRDFKSLKFSDRHRRSFTDRQILNKNSVNDLGEQLLPCKPCSLKPLSSKAFCFIGQILSFVCFYLGSMTNGTVSAS